MVRGDFWKSPLELPQNSPKKDICTLGRKCEQRASFFYAAKGSFRSAFVQCRFWFLPLPLIDFFEASPYGKRANGGGGVKMHGTRRHLAVGLSPSEVQYAAALCGECANARYVAVLCFGRAHARGNTPIVRRARSRASVVLLPSREKSPNCRKKYLNLLKFYPNSVIIS